MKIDRKHDLAVAWQFVAKVPWPFLPEFRFHSVRRWRFDWADPDLKIAIEVEGVTYFGANIGRHQSATGIENDMEKYNRAIQLGWRVLRFSQRMIKADPVGVVEQIQKVILGDVT